LWIGQGWFPVWLEPDKPWQAKVDNNGAYFEGAGAAINTYLNTKPNNSKDNIYIQKVYLNGKPYHKSYITYDDIINGSTLKFEMGKKPAKNFGKASANRPIVLNK
jgi:hypothetical protein